MLLFARLKSPRLSILFSVCIIVASTKSPWGCLIDRLNGSCHTFRFEVTSLNLSSPSVFCSQSFSFPYTSAPAPKLSPKNVFAEDTGKRQAPLPPFLAGLKLVLARLASSSSGHKWMTFPQPPAWNSLQQPDLHNNVYGQKGKQIWVYLGAQFV